MDMMTLRKLIFWILFAIYLIIVFIKNQEKKKRIKEIKNDTTSRITLTPDILLKGIKFETGLHILQIIIALIILKPFTIVALNIDNVEKIGIIALIVLFLCFAGYPLIFIRRNILYIKSITSGNYYVEEDILIKKYSTYHNRNTAYYLELKNEKKRIRITKIEFDLVEAGDKYYIVHGGSMRRPYNATIYQLEDADKIRKRVDD